MRHSILHAWRKLDAWRKLLLIIVILITLLGVITLQAQNGDDYDLSWYSVDGGATTFSAAGDYQLGGISGQPDAGTVAGGVYTLTGGFWAIADPEAQAIFGDGFETGDLSAWSTSVGARFAPPTRE